MVNRQLDSTVMKIIPSPIKKGHFLFCFSYSSVPMDAVVLFHHCDWNQATDDCAYNFDLFHLDRSCVHEAEVEDYLSCFTSIIHLYLLGSRALGRGPRRTVGTTCIFPMVNWRFFFPFFERWAKWDTVRWDEIEIPQVSFVSWKEEWERWGIC